MSSLYKILKTIIQPRRVAGTILEIGPGSIWPGLHLVRQFPQLDMIACGYSPEQRREALERAKQWKCRTRVDYLKQETMAPLPLDDRSADAVVSFGALHLWDQPATLFNEIARVLKVEGDFFIGDVRQDATWLQRTWAAPRHKGLRAMYREKNQALSLVEFRTLLASSRLERGVIQMHGPDIWVIKQ